MKKLFALMLALLAVCGVSRAETVIEKRLNRFTFTTAVITEVSDDLEGVYCTDYKGRKIWLSYATNWHVGDIVTLALVRSNKGYEAYWYMNGGNTTLKKWKTDRKKSVETFYDRITDKDYYPVYYYPLTAVVVENGKAVDYDGREWCFTSEYEYQKDDIVTFFMWNNDTESIKDDVIVAITYSGHAENFFQ